jgi:hypothetical protein
MEQRGTSVDDGQTFRRSEVIARGFEARCTASDGTIFFWHRNFGVQIDRHTSKMTLLTDPKVLPDAPWMATRLGMKELEAQAAVNL